MMVWEMRNLGFGEGAARRARKRSSSTSHIAKLRIMDQVAQEVAEANIQVEFANSRLMWHRLLSRGARSYQRNIDRIRDGQGLPIEVLQPSKLLRPQAAYLRAVADYNRSQLQLLWHWMAC